MNNKIFLVPCNYFCGTANVIALCDDGEILGNEYGSIFGNGYCSGAIPLKEDKEYIDKYKAKYGIDNYELIYVSSEKDEDYEGLSEAIDNCPDLKRK